MPDTLRRLSPAGIRDVTIEGGFWGPRLALNRTATLPHIERQLARVGTLDAWRLRGRPRPNEHVPQFRDSDVAKWFEAAAYSLMTHPDPALERRLDSLVNLLAKAQWEDGYLNTYYTLVEPRNRWTNLRDMHELYCAGHLIEAAVAHHAATGKTCFLEIMCRCADHIAATFGPGRDQKRGYPGHEEIELALVKLYRATGERRYLRLAEFFINERGRRPHYFEREAKARGETQPLWTGLDYFQAHLPVREQQTAEGHAVRAMYLFSALVDVAVETGDRTLLAASRRLWGNVTDRRMYLTGGVGSSRHGERFTFDYDLPNDSAYAETCAAIGLVLWSHRMLQVEDDGEHADVMERALYNGVLSGVSADGVRFSYANPLAVHLRPGGDHPTGFAPERQEWFVCPCCPPNLARLLASLGQYAYSTGPRQASVHLYLQSAADLEVAGQRVALTQRTDYPWQERVRITVEPERPAAWTLALRMPGWCAEPRVAVNGEPLDLRGVVRKGYARLRRRWSPGDRVEVTLPMPVVRVEAHPRVWMNAGRVALQRGPLVYCLEEADNGPQLDDIALLADQPLRAAYDRELLGGAVVITGRGRRRDAGRWGEALYRPGPTERAATRLRAIPYALWGNRGVGEMLVWVQEG